MTDESAGRDPLSFRILIVVYETQISRTGRGVDTDDIVDRVTHGAIARRMAPNRSVVVRCLQELVDIRFLRIDRWSKFRLTSSGWTEGLGRSRETFPWSD